MQKLAGKTALVTGGSRGIGAAIARELANEGANVTITYVNSKKSADELVTEIIDKGGKANAIQADNKNREDIKSVVEQLVEKEGQFDILINNAGIIHAGPIDQFNQEQYDDTMNINVRAVFVAIQAAAVHMADGGRIITIGSCLANRISSPGISLYGMSKSALIGLTKGAARDLGPRNITVNLVHPGPTDTDMNPADGEMADGLREIMAIKRYNRPDEIASMVSWLAGSGAGATTGAEFTIDSGLNV